jgi:hypothetical protein
MPDDILVESAEDYVKLAAGLPAEGAKPTEVTQPKQVENTDAGKPAETASDSDPEEVKDDKSENEPKKHGVQKRIDKLTATIYDLREEVERLKSGPAKGEDKAAQPAKDGDPEPKEDDFNILTDWIKAHNLWSSRQALRERDESQQKQQIAEQEAAEAQELFEAHAQRVSEARTKYPDFDEIVNSAKTPWHDESAEDRKAAIAFQIVVSSLDNSAEVLYHFSKNREELANLGGLSPLKVQQAVWRVSNSLSRPENPSDEKPVTKVPPPIKPVGASGTKSTVKDDDLSDDEWIRQRNKETQGRRKR